MKHYYQNIKGWLTFSELYKKMVERFPSGSHFVEIGCWLGQSATFMGVEIINSGKKIKFDCVDNWEFSEFKTRVNDDDIQQNVDSAYEQFLNNIKPLSDVLSCVKMNSVDASKLYDDESLDFVFIDASHKYDDVMDDLNCWFPKVKVGGVIAGHDYNGAGVKKAVDEFFKGEELEYPDVSWVYNKNE